MASALRWRQVDGVLQRAFGERPAPKLAVGVEVLNGLLSGLKNSFGRLFKFVPSAEGVGAAEAAGTAAAKAATKGEAARIASKQKVVLREEALRLCARNLADNEIRLWPFPTVEPSVGGMLEDVQHVRAAQFGQIDQLRALLDDTPELIDQANDRGMTALMAAAHGGHAAVVKMLLERGADVTCRDDRGVSALDYAIRENKQEVARALLDCGAKVDALKKGLSIESATMLAKIGAEKGIMLSGMTRDQTEANFSNGNLRPADTILIASDLQFTAVLTSLNLGLNNMDNDGAKAIAGALSSGTVVLDKLDVGYNSLNEQAALGIVRAAQQQDKITFLGLGGCGIGPIGAKEIADYIQFTAVLAELQLSANNIGDNGAIAIADALKSGTTVLTNLGLSSNNIGPEGAKAIAGALKSGKAVLTTLFLNNNKIDDDGAMAIAGALFSGTAVLIKLVLWHNNLGNAGEKAMRDVVKGRIGFDLKM